MTDKQSKMEIVENPWYQCIKGKELSQGDILLKTPVFDVPDNYLECIKLKKVPIKINYEDVIIMSQSCDLTHRKIDYVLLCPLRFKKSFKESETYHKPSEWISTIKGGRPGHHVLDECNLEGHNYDFMVVDFRRTYSIKMSILEEFAGSKESRIKLLSPYREHLSQAFARYYMRVGLPSNINEQRLKNTKQT